jgi:integrase
LILLPRRPPFLAPPKTPASHRTIPLPQVVVDALAAHIERFPVDHPDRLVFTDEDGRALRRTAFSREIWRPTVSAVGARRGTGFHELRHFYASLLIRHGESVKTVQRRLGHATAAATLDTYAHPVARLRRPDARGDRLRARCCRVDEERRLLSVSASAGTAPGVASDNHWHVDHQMITHHHDLFRTRSSCALYVP